MLVRRGVGTYVDGVWFCSRQCVEQMARRRLIEARPVAAGIPTVPPMRLGALLRHHGICGADAIERALQAQRGSHLKLGEQLFAMGVAEPKMVLKALAAQAGFAVAQDWPTKPIKLIIGFPPGGGADAVARPIAEALSRELGQPVIVDNKPGAVTTVAAAAAATAAPDGYTLFMHNNSAYGSLQVTYKDFRHSGNDYTPITRWTTAPLLLTVSNEVGVNSVAELVARAKAEPGKLNYASSGQGTPYHMAGELFKGMAGIDVVHVPYRNSGEARSGVVGGQVQMMIDAVPAMAQNVSEKQVRALATTGKTPSSVIPNVPTADAAGLPGYEATIWLGLMAPAGTPRPIIDKLNAAVNAAIRRPELVKLWTGQGATAMSMTPAQFEEFLRGDIVKWGDVAKKFADKPK